MTYRGQASSRIALLASILLSTLSSSGCTEQPASHVQPFTTGHRAKFHVEDRKDLTHDIVGMDKAMVQVMLLRAASTGDVEELQRLAAQGIDVNLRNPTSTLNTALHFAAIENR